MQYEPLLLVAPHITLPPVDGGREELAQVGLIVDPMPDELQPVGQIVANAVVGRLTPDADVTAG
jgi:hypothetical protein